MEIIYIFRSKHNIMRNPSKVYILLLAVLFGSFGLENRAQNYVTTYAGTGSFGFVNGDTSIASFNSPFGICIDPEGNLYLADAQNHCIRKISTEGEVSVYAGTGTAGYLDGPADEAKFNQPLNICFDPEGNMYVSDFINQRIRKISYDMEVTTIAGSGYAGWLNGPADTARFNYPRGICLDDLGNIYVGDSWNHRIRKITPDGTVSDFAGGGTVIGVQSVGDYVDGNDTAARFYTPCELSIDQYNNIFVADAYNHRIRKIDPDALVTTVAGSGGFGPNGGGFNNGPWEEAQFNTPTACHVIPDGTIFVTDAFSQRVHVFAAGGRPLLAFGEPGSGIGELAVPSGVAVWSQRPASEQEVPEDVRPDYYVLVAEQLHRPGVRVYAWLGAEESETSVALALPSGEALAWEPKSAQSAEANPHWNPQRCGDCHESSGQRLMPIPPDKTDALFVGE